MEKICSKCKEEKDISEFYFRKQYNKYYSICKECYKNKEKERYLKNKDKRLKSVYEYRKNNSEKKRQIDNKYYKKNKEAIKLRNKKYREKNKERIKNYTKKRWNKIKNNSVLLLNSRFSSYIRTSLYRNKNGNHWENLVGYTINELIEHLEEISEFTIQDYLEQDLHLDHIIPISSYTFTSHEDEEFKKCWNLRNLRLITAKENLSKFNILDMKLVKKFNINDLLPEWAII